VVYRETKTKHEESFILKSPQHSTLSSKGQITVPQKVREIIRATPGDQIEFVLNNSGEVVVKAIKKDSVLSLFGTMPAKDQNNLVWETIRRDARDENAENLL
jgi:antitoxin PrlF